MKCLAIQEPSIEVIANPRKITLEVLCGHASTRSLKYRLRICYQLVCPRKEFHRILWIAQDDSIINQPESLRNSFVTLPAICHRFPDLMSHNPYGCIVLDFQLSLHLSYCRQSSSVRNSSWKRRRFISLYSGLASWCPIISRISDLSE